MSHGKGGTGIGPMVKSMLIISIKFIFLLIGIVCKISGIILTRCGELCEKISGYGSH